MRSLAQIRLSPVNHLVVDWCHCGKPFSSPCFRKPVEPCARPPKPMPCIDEPVEQGITTYDWLRFMSEVIIGIDDPNEEIAAAYIREAAIEFANTAKILQREANIPLAKGECTYPIEPFEFERVGGIIGVKIKDRAYSCSNFCKGHAEDVEYEFNAQRSEVTIRSRCHKDNDYIQVLFYAVPTEDSCRYDSFLYENFRAGITKVARRRYAVAAHFRDRELMRFIPSEAEANMELMRAKTSALRAHSFKSKSPTLFGGR